MQDSISHWIYHPFAVLTAAELTEERPPRICYNLTVTVVRDTDDVFAFEPHAETLEMYKSHAPTTLTRTDQWVVLSLSLTEAEAAGGSNTLTVFVVVNNHLEFLLDYLLGSNTEKVYFVIDIAHI